MKPTPAYAGNGATCSVRLTRPTNEAAQHTLAASSWCICFRSGNWQAVSNTVLQRPNGSIPWLHNHQPSKALHVIAQNLRHSPRRSAGPTFGHEPFDIPIAQAEAEVQPNAVADKPHRELMTLVEGSRVWYLHAASMPHEVRARKVARVI
jgi:hypothetical protein